MSIPIGTIYSDIKRMVDKGHSDVEIANHIQNKYNISKETFRDIVMRG